MPNDAILDPTVLHLFAKDQFNRWKSNRSWPLYPRCGHDLSPPRCPPFLEAGTPDLLWLYKSQRKASEKKTEGKTEQKKSVNSQRRKREEKKKERTRRTQKKQTGDEWRSKRDRKQREALASQRTSTSLVSGCTAPWTDGRGRAGGRRTRKPEETREQRGREQKRKTRRTKKERQGKRKQKTQSPISTSPSSSPSPIEQRQTDTPNREE